jgi:hypothetical protein
MEFKEDFINIWQSFEITKHRICGVLFMRNYIYIMGTALAQGLRSCATIQKVAGSIPTGVSGFFIDIQSF